MVALKSLRPPLFVFALLLALSGSAARASAIETRATPEPRDPAPNQAAEAPPSPEGAPPVEAARVTGEPVETKADSIDFHRDTKRAVATGNVVVTYRSTRLTADKVSVDNLTKDAFAEGNVHIFQAGQSEWHGDHVQYNFGTGAVNAGAARAFSDAYFMSAGKTESQSREHYLLKDSEFTTSEYYHPSWKWACSSVLYYPDDRIVFHNAVLYAGDVPILYIPYFVYDLEEIKIGMDVKVGHTGTWGPFVLASYRLDENKYITPVFKFDYRDRRGFAGGIDLEYLLGKNEKGEPGADGQGKLETYVADDKKYRDQQVQDVPRPDRPGTHEVRINPDRYRLRLLQKYNPLDDLETTVKLDKLSDEKLLEDFFEKDLRHEQYPDNYVEVQKYDEYWTLNLLARPQMNRFFTTTERLPDISFNLPRQAIGGGFYYETEDSMALLARRNYDSSQRDYNSARVDSFHQITYPVQLGGWLNVVPRAGVRGTYYSHSQLGGSPNDTSIGRGVYNVGIEFSTKIHRTWEGVQNHALQIDGLRHIFEPSINYAWVPQPNHQPRDILQFDTGVPSAVDTKLRPIDFPQDVGIDNINTRNVVRPMLRNRWQTKRDGQPYNFLDTAIYQDLNIESENNRVLSNLFWAMDFHPTTWLRLGYDSQYDYYKNIIRESNVSAVYQYYKDWELGISHRFLHGEESNELSPYFAWRLNEDWAFRTQERIGPSDGRFREGIFSIDRDLSSWVVSWSVRYLNPTVDPEELQFWMVWTLKAFPEATAQFSP